MSAEKRSKIVLETIGDDEIAISPFTIHEILLGLENEDPKWSKFLDDIILINYDKQCAEISAEIDKTMSKAGTKLGIIDVLIASVAIRNRLQLVTFDRAFSRIKDLDVKVLS